jgi:hypothetical protein
VKIKTNRWTFQISATFIVAIGIVIERLFG